MAKELVLVPKRKYEHLLKLVKETEQKEQSGGQGTSEEIPPPESHIKRDDIVPNEGTNSSPDSRGESEMKGEEEKPRLYVNKPLSEMPFENSHALASSRKEADSVEASSRTRKSKMGSGIKRSRKGKWINYIV